MTDLQAGRSLEDLAADFLMHKHGYYLGRALTAQEMRTVLLEAIGWGKTSRWLSVSDCMPAPSAEPAPDPRYVVESKAGARYLAEYVGGEWTAFDCARLTYWQVRPQIIVRWMPLPESAKG